MRTALLRGRDHTRVGELATVAEERLALALSRGGAPKTYSYQDPNEDACAFAFTADALFAAVADGHWGAAGAVLVLERLLARHVPGWLAGADVAARWRERAPEVALDLNATLVGEGTAGDLPGRTTLTLCVARPREGRVLALAVGDSHLFHVSARGAGAGGVREIVPVADARARFLGDAGLDRENVAERVRADVLEEAAEGVLLLATDGLSETGIGVADPPKAAAASATRAREAEPDLRPLTAARCLAEHAMDAHRRNTSGDNIATAALWLEASEA